MSLLSVSVESELSFLWKNHNGALKKNSRPLQCVIESSLHGDKNNQYLFIYLFIADGVSALPYVEASQSIVFDLSDANTVTMLQTD